MFDSGPRGPLWRTALNLPSVQGSSGRVYLQDTRVFNSKG